MTTVASTYVILANDRSGGVTDDLLDDVGRRLGHARVVRLDRPEALDDALRSLGDEIPVVVGGDGTVHAALQSVDRVGWTRALGLVPAGTGNDFARNVGVPLTVADATSAIAGGSTAHVDVARTSEGTLVANNVHVGASVVATQRAQPLKRWLGRFSYPLASAVTALVPPSTELRVTVDGEVLFDGSAVAVAVYLGPSFGGGLRVTDASPGHLGVMVAPMTSFVERVRAMTSAALSSAAETDTTLTADGARVRLEGSDPLEVVVDGEVVRWGREIELVHEPVAWMIYTPEPDDRR